MKIIVLANAEQKEELLAQEQSPSAEVIWITDTAALHTIKEADAFIDLLFDNSQERIKELYDSGSPLTIINSVVKPPYSSINNFIRINGWTTFLKRPIVEASGNEAGRQKAEEIFSSFNKKTGWVTDITGFLSARVIAGIINEAYFALEEQVSSKQEIDTAMKLGTNYPYGPFEWSEKIGLKNIYSLLTHLAKEQKRYEPAALLIKEASI